MFGVISGNCWFVISVPQSYSRGVTCRKLQLESAIEDDFTAWKHSFDKEIDARIQLERKTVDINLGQQVLRWQRMGITRTLAPSHSPKSLALRGTSSPSWLAI